MKLIREINDEYSIKQATDIAKYIKEFTNEDREYTIILGLDSKNQVLYRDIVSIGTLNSCLIHPREVFKTAIIKSANSIIFIHNHPAGETEPSQDDIEASKKLKATGEIIGIKLLDSIIIANNQIDSYLQTYTC